MATKTAADVQVSKIGDRDTQKPLSIAIAGGTRQPKYGGYFQTFDLEFDQHIQV